MRERHGSNHDGIVVQIDVECVLVTGQDASVAVVGRVSTLPLFVFDESRLLRVLKRWLLVKHPIVALRVQSVSEDDDRIARFHHTQQRR